MIADPESDAAAEAVQPASAPHPEQAAGDPLCNADASVVAGLKLLVDDGQRPVVIFADDGAFVYVNRAFQALAEACADSPGGPAARSLGDVGVDLVPDAAIAAAQLDGEWSGVVFVAPSRGRDMILQLQVRRLLPAGDRRQTFGAVFRDATEEYSRDRELQNRNADLEAANAKIQGAQEQLIQTEKLASIGQLAAGVAHEINNPMGYVHSNLETLVTYTQHLLALIEAYDVALTRSASEEDIAEIREMRRRFDIDFVRTDLPQLLTESREGAERVRKIIQDLKDFSRSDASDGWALADVHRGLDSTLNIVWNELKYKARVVKNYAELPPIRCIPSELNQVFLNVLVNAGQAIEQNGIVTLTTSREDDFVCIAIDDDGAGIAEDLLPKIFDPFFTTKPVGKGTGLGLSISYGIIKKHGGRIEVSSVVGAGTTFRILLPLSQPFAAPASSRPLF
jgi:signal transduction histidine kinase